MRSPAFSAILVADPHAAIAELIAHELRSRYRVLAPISLFDFIPHAIRMARPAAVILELEFGTRSVVRLLRDLAGCAEAPTMLVFCDRESELDRELALAAGAAAVISKGAGLDRFDRAVDEAMARLPSRSVGKPSQLLRAILAPHCAVEPEDVHREVLWLLCSGFTYAEVAERIGRGEKDVQYHASAWRRTLGAQGAGNRLDWTALPFEECALLGRKQH